MDQDRITVTGMVVAAIPVGDYDKRISILTRELGLVQAFVRGAKRPNSQFSAAANPFAFGSFELHPGRTAYNLVHVNIKNYFEGILGDLDAIYYGSYFLELAAYYGRENVEAGDQLNLMYMTMFALQDGRFSNQLVRVIYELKTLVINGEYPEVFQCRVCKKSEDLLYFSSRRGGCICSHCQKEMDSIKLEDSALYTMQYIIQSPIDRLYSFQVTEPVLRNLQRVLKDYFKVYIDRKFKSLAFLET